MKKVIAIVDKGGKWWLHYINFDGFNGNKKLLWF